MRKQNVVVFSSGNAATLGFTDKVKKILEKKYDCLCQVWHDDEGLFKSNNPENKALLPLLLKKIPTYDFAVLIADKCDKVTIHRDKKRLKVPVTRDNVILELGFSIMALGAQKTLLLRQKHVRLPEDIVGLNGENGIFIADFKDENDLDGAIERLGEVIKEKQAEIFPIVIGAAGATAAGYFAAVVDKFFKNIKCGINYFENSQEITVFPSLDDIEMRILVPTKITDSMPKIIADYYEGIGAIKAEIKPEKERPLYFKMLKKNGKYIVVVDIPTTLTASYDTVKKILSLDADDKNDNNAEERFLMKEVDLFIFSLKKIRDSYKDKGYYSNIHIDVIEYQDLVEKRSFLNKE
ncbi:MAG: putative nucleotide-binding protein containing TIR-like domain protein [Pelotomaculum sp. PtaB.Bin104]|nr:MAG: putative nucleotide-binding protein containing TIR-like domain protein [Pelotomaculum sp. PtaB.Bin104]